MVKSNIIKGRYIGLPLQFWLLFIFLVTFTSVGHAASLSDAQQDYLSGNYEEAIAKANRLRESDETLYFLGLIYTKTTDYQRSRIFFRRLISHYPGSKLYEPAMMKLADTYFLDKDYDNAKELYQEIENRCPRLENKSLLFLRQAQIASRQGDWDNKRKYLELIKNKYPKSPEMAFVETLESYGDFFIVQVGAFTGKKNALLLTDELIGKGYKASIVEDKKNGYLLHKVQIGRYKDRYEANKVSRELLDQGYPARIYP